MTIPDDVSLWLQRALRDLSADDWTFARMVFWKREFEARPNEQSSIMAWQFSLDFIKRCLAAELIQVINYERYSSASAILDALRKNNPYERGGPPRSGDLAWNGIFICGTEKLLGIVNRFFGDDDAAHGLNEDFISEIQKVFRDAGVPWSSVPLEPLVPG